MNVTTSPRNCDKINQIVPIMQEHLGTYKGVAFPLIVTMPDKRGSSNWEERTRLIDRFMRLFGAGCIDPLVAERELVGKEWVGNLFHGLKLWDFID